MPREEQAHLSFMKERLPILDTFGTVILVEIRNPRDSTALKNITALAIAFTAVALTVFTGGWAQAQYPWNSASSNDPGLGTNYSGGVAPTLGASNSPGIWTTTATALDFTTSGTTTLGAGTTVSSLNWIGEYANTTVNVTNGTVDYSGGWSNDGGTESLWIGNGSGANASLIINGGAVNVLNGTLLGRDSATGNISVTNGSFTTGAYNASIGLSFNLENNDSSANSLTIGNGGLFEVGGAALQPIQFQTLTAGVANSGNNFIDFTAGSTGTLELNLSTATLGSSYFSDLVTNGYVEVDGNLDDSVSDFAINTNNLSTSTLKLAPTPEPSTWALMLGGVVALVMCRSSGALALLLLDFVPLVGWYRRSRRVLALSSSHV